MSRGNAARRHAAWLAVLCALLCVPLAVASSASAALGITDFSARAVDAGGADVTQAGAHPYDAVTSFTLATTLDAGGSKTPSGSLKDVDIEMPPGLVINPLATPRCTMTDFAMNDCSPASIIGEEALSYAPFPLPPAGNPFTFTTKVYNIISPDDVSATFAFKVATVSVVIRGGVRSDGSYHLAAGLSDLSQALPIYGSKLTLWGVPADRNGGNAPRRALVTNPTTCGTTLTSTMRADAWQAAGSWASASYTSPVQVDGCEKLVLPASVSVTPDAKVAGQPSGLGVTIDVPNNEDPDGLATPQVRDVRVQLPAGMAISPAAGDGLAGCTDAQIGLGSMAPGTCPDASRIGSVQIDTPLMEKPMQGGVFLAKPDCAPCSAADAAAGRMVRLYIEAQGGGVVLKLPGSVSVEPGTGRLTTTFADNPQLPFSRMTLHFKGGPRAPLSNPPACGTQVVHTAITPWSSATAVTGAPVFAIDQGCGQGQAFKPAVDAGVANPVAGASSSFVLRVSRSDGQQELGAINGSLPPGLLGVLASVPLCSAAQGAAGTCPAASRIGKVDVASGPGSQPLWLPIAGQGENAVYLTEPYRKGDVAGMSIVTRAIAGPLDLGTVVTRVYLKLRDEDQGIDLQSDKLPRMLAGVPLGLREVRVTVDRDGFMVNPTSCRELGLYTNVFAQSWAKVPVMNRFQVGGCSDLAFSPIITAQAGGKGNVKRYQHPALKVTVRQPAGQAHLDRVNVVLPKKLNIDLKAPALKAACPRDVYAKDQCSPVATVGTVKAVTPLLREPLEGPAFLIQKKGKLPDLVMRLRNNRMSLDLIGVLDFLKNGRLITRVKGIPDAALSSFVLQIKGGKDGSLLNRSDLCAKRRLVKSTFAGQNGKRSYKTPLLHLTGCGKARATARAKAKAKARRSSHAAARRADARAAAAGGAHAVAGARAAARGGQRAAGGAS